jgi:hypothetical protein
MKVRMNQAVQLEDVPKSIAKIFETLESESKLVATMAEQAAQLARLVSEIEVNSGMKYKLLLQLLQEMKINSAEMDQTIIDIAHILDGYIGIVDKESTTPVPAPQPAPAKPQFDDSDLTGPGVKDYKTSPPDATRGA